MASEGKTVNAGRREGSGIMVNEGGRWARAAMIQKESIELLILLLQGGQSFSCVPFPPPAEPGALWMQGRGDNSGNMVLLSLASPLGGKGTGFVGER